MQAQTAKVKKAVVPVQIGGMTVGIILGQADPVQAEQRVRAALVRHGWLGGQHPRDLVRLGGRA